MKIQTKFVKTTSLLLALNRGQTNKFFAIIT